jgi:hypothetical protein
VAHGRGCCARDRAGGDSDNDGGAARDAGDGGSDDDGSDVPRGTGGDPDAHAHAGAGARDGGAVIGGGARPRVRRTSLPPGFELRDLDTAPRGHEPGWLEVWATPGAHRSKGSWFAIQINDDGKVEARSTADRVDVGRNRFGLLSHTSDGVALLRFITPGGTGVAITAGGWTDADLIALASGMGHVGLRPVFGTSPMMDQHEMLWSGPAVGVSVDEAYAFGDARAGSTYEREDDGATIAISVAPAHPAEAILPRFVLAEDPDVPFSGHFVRRSLDGRALTVGLLPGLDDQRIVTWWEDDGTRVSVVGDLPLGELIDVVGSVHGASAEDWSEAMMEARGFEADGRPPGAAADDVGRVIGLFGEILD